MKLISLLLLIGFLTADCDFKKSGPISFENADITIAIQTASGGRVAQAFNLTSGTISPHKMRWVSLGVPRLLARNIAQNSSNSSTNSSKPVFFEFVQNGFYAYIETLSSPVAAELAKEASVKYDYRIDASQFLPIDKYIGRFSCFTDLFNSDKKFVRVHGDLEIIGNPVSIFFRLPNTSEEYDRSLATSERPVIIKCNVVSRVRDLKYGPFSACRSPATLEESNIYSNPFCYSEISTQVYTPNEEGAFNEFISVNTEDFRVADKFIEGYEFAHRTLMQEVLDLKNDLNKSNLQLQRQQSESSRKVCGNVKFDLNRSSKDLTYSADRKIITRHGSAGFRGAYVEGFLPQRGTSELWIKAHKAQGRGDMSGVMLGLASDGLPLPIDEYQNADQILVNLHDGGFYGGAADRRGVGAAGAAIDGDVIKAVYDADANTIAFYRNCIAWGPTLNLTQNAIAKKAKLMFFVSVYYEGQKVTLV